MNETKLMIETKHNPITRVGDYIKGLFKNSAVGKTAEGGRMLSGYWFESEIKKNKYTDRISRINMIDEYLADCKERNIEPEQPYKGTFNVRISPELHRNIAVYAIEHGKSLNAAVEEAIGNMVRA